MTESISWLKDTCLPRGDFWQRRSAWYASPRSTTPIPSRPQNTHSLITTSTCKTSPLDLEAIPNHIPHSEHIPHPEAHPVRAHHSPLAANALSSACSFFCFSCLSAGALTCMTYTESEVLLVELDGLLLGRLEISRENRDDVRC